MSFRILGSLTGACDHATVADGDILGQATLDGDLVPTWILLRLSISACCVGWSS
jgi:hypothetical protein